MTNLQQYAFETTKDIVVAKLSQSSPSSTNADVGKNIGDMFEEIYNKVYEICCKKESK